MKDELQRARSYASAHKRCIDPCRPVVEAIFLILLYLRCAGFDAESGSPALSKARHYVLVLLRRVRQMNGMTFWRFLVLSKSQRKVENIQDHHSELLMIARDNLQGGPASRADILAAMDVIHEVVASMSTLFVAGKVRNEDELDDSWNLDRYASAALLPALAEQLNNFWVQLRKNRDTSEK